MSQEEIIEKLVSIYKIFFIYLMGKMHIRKSINAPFYWNSGQAADSNHAGSTGKDRPGCGNAFITQADSSQNGIMQNKSSSHMILKKKKPIMHI